KRLQNVNLVDTRSAREYLGFVRAFVARVLAAIPALASVPAHAEIFRWIDDDGRTHYSTAAPPSAARATVVGATAKGGFVSAIPVDWRQGEQIAPRLAQGEPAKRDIAQITAPLPPVPARGLEFRKFISITHGMSEGSVLEVAGEPDLQARDGSY